MSDDHEHEGGDGEHGQGERGEGGGGAVGGMAGGVSEALGGVSDLLGEGDDTEEAREGLETASDVADGVREGAKTPQELGKVANAVQGGDIGSAAGGLGSALGSAGAGVGALTGAIGGMVPDAEARRALGEASRVASAVGQVARGVGQFVEGAADLLGDLFGARHPVHYDLHIADEDTHLAVRHVSLHEALGQLYDGWIEATFPSSANLDEQELLSKDVSLAIERGDERRHFRGIVRHASVRRAQEHQVLHLDVAPALWLAEETLDSRVYQEVTVPDLVEQVINELIGESRQRTVRRELTETYEPHEYLVQHRESHYQFISRLMREEGIFFYFDHDADGTDHEVFVMGDSNSNRPLVRPAYDGVIQYEEQENSRDGREVAISVHHEQRVGASDAANRGFDWTNPGLNVHHERTERADWNGPRLEVYDHHHAVRHHGYDDGGGSYQSHTAERRSRLSSERLDLARTRWSVETTVVTAQPGHVFELQGADIHDGRYLIVSMSSNGTTGDHGGEYTNSLRVVPTDMPYRPTPIERPMMPGPETAIVVGPAGEEIHTDRHGRIKVQFHWDRQGQRDEHSSAWIRVSQAWAGPGWGFVFIPRIGMEVIVSFLGGDPDRPIVTGCVYNGSNPPPYPLPDEKTKSTIKTNSSLGGGGSNELRFEDKKGSEEVYIHAEKDFNEVVEHNHSTHVKNDQTNTVDHDQTETVGHDQTLTVKNNRTKTVNVDEVVTVKNNRRHTVNVDDVLSVLGKHSVSVLNGELINIMNGQQVQVLGDRQSTVITNDRLTTTGYHHVSVGSYWKVDCGASNVWMDDGSLLVDLPQVFRVSVTDRQSTLLMGLGSINIEASAGIELKVGESKITMNAAEIKIEAPSVAINASTGATDINAATQVKIKC